MADASGFTLSPYADRARLQVKGTKRIGYSFFTSATDGRLEETVIALKDLPYSLHCRYADFTMLGNDVFPQSIEMMSEGTDKKYSLDMKLSRINTDSNWDSKTELSSKYRKMSVQELLKLFIKTVSKDVYFIKVHITIYLHTTCTVCLCTVNSQDKAVGERT